MRRLRYPPVGLIDPACPVNWADPLNRGLVSRWTAVRNPGWRGGVTFRDLVRGGRKPNDGTLTNGPTWTGPRGRRGGWGALSFTAASSQYVDCGVVTALRGATQARLSGWVYRADTSHVVVFGQSHIDSALRFGILWFSDGKVYCQAENGTASFPNCALAGTGWHLLEMHYDGGLTDLARLKVFIDGTPQSLTAGGASPAASLPGTEATQGLTTLGREQVSGTTRYSTGLIDDVRVWAGVGQSEAHARENYLDSLLGSPRTLRFLPRRTWFVPQAGEPGGGGNRRRRVLLCGRN